QPHSICRHTCAQKQFLPDCLTTIPSIRYGCPVDVDKTTGRMRRQERYGSTILLSWRNSPVHFPVSEAISGNVNQERTTRVRYAAGLFSSSCFPASGGINCPGVSCLFQSNLFFSWYSFLNLVGVQWCTALKIRLKLAMLLKPDIKAIRLICSSDSISCLQACSIRRAIRNSEKLLLVAFLKKWLKADSPRLTCFATSGSFRPGS